MGYRESERTGLQLEEAVLSNDDLIVLAERELAAFARAVKELFGPEQASLSIAEWIDELESLNWHVRPEESDFRRISTAASSRIARRDLFRPSQEDPIETSTSSRSHRL